MSSMYGSTGAVNKDNVPTGYKKGSTANFTPEMMKLFQQMFSHVGPDSYTARLAGGDESLFAEMEAPALRQFSGVQGNLASRFSGMGSGARKSSGFQNTINQAGSDFAQDLQSRRQGLQRQAISDLMGMSNQLLGQRPYENYLVPRQNSAWQEAGIGAATGFGQAVGAGITGGFGGFGGASASSGFNG